MSLAACKRTRTARSAPRRQPAKAALSAQMMRRHADEAVELLKAVGSHNRLLLLCQLVGGERSVGELAQTLGLSQSVVSQHLGLLRRDGIVSGRRDAQSIHYRISDDRARALMTTLFGLFCTRHD